MTHKELTCGCGGDNGVHFLESEKCLRKLAVGELIPTNFRKENGIDVCDVNGYTITAYTLFNQRLYHNHGGGNWSLPKDESSVNSIEMND